MKPYQRNQWFALGMIILGGLLIVLSLVFASSSTTALQSIGWALLAIGIVRGVRLYRIRRTPEKQREFEIQQTDERLQFIRQKAISWTFWVSIFIELIAGLVLQSVLFDSPWMQLGTGICMFVCAQTLLYAVLYVVFSKKF